jgi:RHH-type proline utilization regulon transcriptional repressor/proline dehydrogenase/delta 1-pyrroline-5-carboxylate dehydrogenase
LQFLPGLGEEVGAHLVAHRDVAGVAFTGSMAVGLAIWKQAGVTLPGQRSLKRVVCEMGGKNAIIVDADADLDEAVLGTLHSAFGFAGQKCSACSRVIVLAEHYDAFVTRLAEAIAQPEHARGQPGAALDPHGPGHRRGGLAPHPGHDRRRGRAARPEAPHRRQRALRGYYIPPTLFGDVPPTDPLAQDEVFGPVLAAMRATSFDRPWSGPRARRTASRAASTAARRRTSSEARRAFRVGNLYINRPITGAIVGRHPFGGFHMSGGGTKAGGPDYLLSFVDPRVVSENTHAPRFRAHGAGPDEPHRLTPADPPRKSPAPSPDEQGAQFASPVRSQEHMGCRQLGFDGSRSSP